MILNKIDEEFPLANNLRELLNSNRSLDNIIDRIVIPVLLTYESKTVSSHNRVTKQFEQALEQEITANWHKFANKKLPQDFRVELILLPIKSKESFITCLDGVLDKWK